MTDATIDEKALQAEIDEARTKLNDTKQLYKWVCSILFFKYGITPTTNRLYQLVRKGSMQTVTTSLSAFWEDLRERSRLKIDHPGVPASLVVATGDLVQAIWENASIEARALNAAAQSEASAKVEAAKLEQLAAEKQLEDAQHSSDAINSKLTEITSELSTALQEFESERQAHGATSARLEEARAEVLALRTSVSEARQDFTNELEKARAATRVAEAREAATERRTLLEVYQERVMRAEAETKSNQMQEDLNAAHRKEVARSEASAQEIGELKGKLAAAEQMVRKWEEQVASLRQELSTRSSEVAHCEGELTAARSRIAALERAIEVATSSRFKSPKSRKG